MTVEDLFGHVQQQPVYLDGCISAMTSDEFKSQFRAIFGSDTARRPQGVVYVWAMGKEIPRARGYSNIIYIGLTKGTLCSRYFSWAEHEGTFCFSNTYQYLIEKYGPMTFSPAVVDDPRRVEKEMLGYYRKVHLELPPLNCLS